MVDKFQECRWQNFKFPSLHAHVSEPPWQMCLQRENLFETQPRYRHTYSIYQRCAYNKHLIYWLPTNRLCLATPFHRFLFIARPPLLITSLSTQRLSLHPIRDSPNSGNFPSFRSQTSNGLAAASRLEIG